MQKGTKVFDPVGFRLFRLLISGCLFEKPSQDSVSIRQRHSWAEPFVSVE